ncbi:molybdopterin-dependent oxidoreductase [Brevibacillus sp. NRS-1366]|uniref:molybdopterin-dependent oxidoreductase n=1 Tax=Brevibacillus sp. NRS-1366 TaxID=3233899 RepID=UPI003D1AA50E
MHFRDFLQIIKVTPQSSYVMLHGDHDYTANVPLADLDRDDVLLAHSFGGSLAWPCRSLRMNGR